MSGALPGGQEEPSPPPPPPPPPPDAGEGVLPPLDPGHMSHVTGQYCSAMTLDSPFVHPFMLYVFMTKEVQSEKPLRELCTSASAKPSLSSTQLPPPDAGEGVLSSPRPPPLAPPWVAQMHVLEGLHSPPVEAVFMNNSLPFVWVEGEKEHPTGLPSCNRALTVEIPCPEVREIPSSIAAARHSAVPVIRELPVVVVQVPATIVVEDGEACADVEHWFTALRQKRPVMAVQAAVPQMHSALLAVVPSVIEQRGPWALALQVDVGA